ncbi:hypothetical protein AX16_004961 [Volvariella volvacea WC 439]|nr:hypothetical protein AX16_004961 [Volvariella volvacea WC 439]
MSLNLLGMKAVPLPTKASAGFFPSVEDCEALITPWTRAIALVTPNNPVRLNSPSSVMITGSTSFNQTGAIYPSSLLASFLALARKHDVALILDETYRDFILTGPPHKLFDSQDWRTNLIHLFSFSKSYCIPGHRLGAIVASPAFIEQVITVLDCLQICPPRPPQIALEPLLPALRSFVHHNAVQLEQRHALFKKLLPQDWVIGSQGAYYTFVKHPFTGVSAEEVCKRLAVDLGVVTLPVSFFRDNSTKPESDEDDRWVRFSVANVDDEKLARVCERLAESEKVFGWTVKRNQD